MPRLEFANVVINFGQEKVLADYYYEIVEPSFLDATLVRATSGASYFFLDTQLIRLEEEPPVFGICGRYVKDTELSRTQIFEPATRELLRDAKTIPSAPSSLFLLVLNSHRLVYMKEESAAPSLGTFCSTLQQFLRSKWKAHIDHLHEGPPTEPESEQAPLTKTELRALHPKPEVQLIPLVGAQDMMNFVDRFELLQQVRISVGKTNHELDNSPLFDGVRQIGVLLESKKADVVYRNNAGLDKQVAIEQLESVGSQGTNKITFSGKSQDGSVLSGSNEDFKLKAEIQVVNSNPPSAAAQMFAKFKDLTAAGIFQVPAASEKTLDLINRLKNR